jgi:hypothetical protein
MARRGKGTRRGTAGRNRTRRRRLIRAAGLLAGAALAAGGGWLYTGAHHTAHGHATPTPAAARTQVPFGLPSADASVHGGTLHVPVVDVTEVLPTCHN